MLFPFSTRVSQDSSHDYDQRVAVSNYGDGYAQRAAVGINSQYQMWNVQVNHLTLAQRTVMVNFWKAHGRVQSFDWTPPNETAGKYVFDSPLSESNHGELYSFAMTLRQVFE